MISNEFEIEYSTFMESLNSSYDGMMSDINNKLSSASNTYYEFSLIEHFVSEKVQNHLFENIKLFFKKLMLSLKEFQRDLTLKIEYTIREKQLKKKLDDMYQSIKNDPGGATAMIEITDFWNYKNLYLELNKKLSVYAKKFTKMKYTKTYQIEDDIEAFEKIITDYGNQLEIASKKTITMPKIKVLDFIEDEIRGKSEVLKTINDNMREFQEMAKDANDLERRLYIFGADVIPKHVSFIQRIANAISSFVRKWVTKFVVAIVFRFA